MSDTKAPERLRLATKRQYACVNPDCTSEHVAEYVRVDLLEQLEKADAASRMKSMLVEKVRELGLLDSHVDLEQLIAELEKVEIK